MKTVHIFYNGNEANFPTDNDWEKFTGQDSVRLFLLTCETWRRAGWNVKRLQTVSSFEKDETYERQDFRGRIAREGKWYPWPNWQFIAKARTLQPDDDGEIWFSTYDVPNFGYYPSRGSVFDLWDEERTGCVSFQRGHFSLACFVASPFWLTVASQILANYDAEKLPRIPGKYTSDETILRNYAEYAMTPLQSFPLSDYRSFPLIHYARSTLKGAYEEIPVV